MIDFLKRYWLLVSLSVLVLSSAIFVRASNLLETPPSLYWEEVALGYDAYSIAQTGKDHHGNPWPLVAFESFGDWKPSLYFYTLVPFVSLFGLTPWVVRLPAVISGFATVVAVGVLSYQVAKQLALPKPSWFGLIGLCVGAISPWLVVFSRAGWEVGLATALISWGVVAGLAAVQGKRFAIWLAIFCSILLSLAVYAYHGTRVVAPLVGLLLAGYWCSAWPDSKTKINAYIQRLLAPALVALLLLLPIMISLRSPQVTQRFAETSIFSNLDIIIESNEAKAKLGNSFISSLAYHRYVLFGREIIKNYVSHFNLDYLVVSGDVNARHSTGYSGILYYLDLLFIAIGVGVFCYRKKSVGIIILGWWLLGIIPAALTTAVPHALRTLPSAPAVLICIAIGIGYGVIKMDEVCSRIWPKNKQLLTIIALLFSGSLLGAYSLMFAQWWRYYQAVYPKVASSEWQYGYQQMIEAQVELAKKYADLPQFITREQGRPAMYYWFFTKTDPTSVQAAEAISAHDQGEFVTFEQISFPNSTGEITVNQAVVTSSPDGLAAIEARGYTISDIATITDTANKPVWQVYRISKK